MVDIKKLVLSQRQRLLDALLACNSLSEPDNRQAVINRLDGPIRNRIKRFDDNSHDVDAMLTACSEVPHGLQQLLAAIQFFDRGTHQFEALQSLVDELTNIQKLVALLENAPMPQEELVGRMRQVYNIYLQDNRPGYQEDTHLNTIEEILASLQDMSQGTAPESPVIHFVARLLEAEMSEPTASRLKEWGEQNAKNFLKLLSQKDNRLRKTRGVPTYLLVLIKPNEQRQGKRYSISAWFIPDGRSDEFNYRTGTGYISLEIQNWEKETFSLREIPGVLKDFFNQINNKHITDNSVRPVIMFFLPFKLLNDSVEKWEVDNDFPIGIDYQVVVRSCGKLKNYGFRRDWIQKWEQISNPDSINIVSGDCDWKALTSKLSESNAICLKLIQPPSQKTIEVFDRTATPVAIWLRNKLDSVNCQTEIDALLEGVIAELPGVVMQKRQEAFPVDIENHIGHHLSLLWEHPHLLPPSIDYATP